MKKLIALLLTCVMALSLVACGGSNNPSSSNSGNSGDTDKVYEINVNLNFPEVSASGYLKWCDEVVEATGGRVKFNNYYSYSLLALADVVKGLQTGLADMSAITLYEYPSIFTLNGNVFGLPFLGWKDEASASQIYWEMMEECPALQAEYSELGLHYISGYAMPGYNLFLTKASDITTPADLKGHKTITVASAAQQLLADNGGAPVSAGPTDYYSNLEKGVADSVISHINVLGAFGVAPELIKKAVYFGDEYSGAYMYMMGFAFSDSFWNKLPEDIQAVFTEKAPLLGQYCLEADMALTGVFLEKMDAAGVEKVVLSDDEVKVWADALSAHTAEEIAEWSGADSNTESIYNTILDKIAASK